MRIYFCEGCGKRVTDRDIEAGKARDKQLAGVYCSACARGVATQAELPVDEKRSSDRGFKPARHASGSRIAPARAGKRPPPVNARGGDPRFVLSVIAGAALLLIGGVLLRPSPSSPRPAKQEETARLAEPAAPLPAPAPSWPVPRKEPRAPSPPPPLQAADAPAPPGQPPSTLTEPLPLVEADPAQSADATQPPPGPSAAETPQTGQVGAAKPFSKTVFESDLGGWTSDGPIEFGEFQGRRCLKIGPAQDLMRLTLPLRIPNAEGVRVRFEYFLLKAKDPLVGFARQNYLLERTPETWRAGAWAWAEVNTKLAGYSGAIESITIQAKHDLAGAYLLLREVRVECDVAAMAGPGSKPAEDLVAHWKLDDGSGTSAADSTGHGHAGTLHGNPAWTSGKLGQGAQCDGNGDWLEFPEVVDMKALANWSVAMWFKLDALPSDSNDTFLWKYTDSGPSKDTPLYVDNDNRIKAFNGDKLSTGVTVQTGTWYHVAGVRDGSTYKIYVNGELKASDSNFRFGTDGASCEVFKADGKAWGHGTVDDLRVYSKSLSATEVAQLARLEALEPASAPPDPAFELALEVRQELAPLLRQQRFDEAASLAARRQGDPRFAAAAERLAAIRADVRTVQAMRLAAIGQLKARQGQKVTLKKGAESLSGTVMDRGQPDRIGLQLENGPEFVLSADQLEVSDILSILPDPGEAEDARRRALLAWAAGLVDEAKAYFAKASESGKGEQAGEYLREIEALETAAAETVARQVWEKAERFFAAEKWKEALSAYREFEAAHANTPFFQQEKPNLEARLQAIDKALSPYKPGLAAFIYSGKEFHPADLLKRRVDAKVAFEWNNGAPGPDLPSNNFCIRWVGFVRIEKAGEYTFATKADDGQRLWIGTQQIIEDWNPHGPTRKAGPPLRLAPGFHPVQIEYFEGGSTASMSFYWSCKDGWAEEIVPEDALFHDPNVLKTAK